jgi:YD repeat-containing protein
VTTAFGTPDAATVQYAYDAIGQRISETDARGNPTTTGYVYNTGTHEKTVTVTPPAPFTANTTTTTFNAIGQRIKTLNARGNPTTYTYDVRGSLRTTTYPDNTVDEIQYDGAGQVLKRIDQALKATTYTYFDDGRLHTVANPLSETTTYGYDAVGNLTSILDANNHTTAFQYNGLHQRIKQTLPINTIAANSTYDPDGNLSTFIDFNGKTTTYSYDALNRLQTIAPDASLTGQTPIGFTYYPTGQRKTMTDASGTTTYAYTARNQLLSKATPQGTLSYTYNLAGGVQTLRSSNTTRVTYVRHVQRHRQFRRRRHNHEHDHQCPASALEEMRAGFAPRAPHHPEGARRSAPPAPCNVRSRQDQCIGTCLRCAEIQIISCRSDLPIGMRARRSAYTSIKLGFPGATPWAGGAGGAAAPCRRPRRATASKGAWHAA